jgi:hypothetical protein
MGLGSYLPRLALTDKPGLECIVEPPRSELANSFSPSRVLVGTESLGPQRCVIGGASASREEQAQGNLDPNRGGSDSAYLPSGATQYGGGEVQAAVSIASSVRSQRASRGHELLCRAVCTTERRPINFLIWSVVVTARDGRCRKRREQGPLGRGR